MGSRSKTYEHSGYRVFDGTLGRLIPEFRIKGHHGSVQAVALMDEPKDRSDAAMKYANRKSFSPARVTTLKKLTKVRYMMNGVK